MIMLNALPPQHPSLLRKPQPRRQGSTSAGGSHTTRYAEFLITGSRWRREETRPVGPACAARSRRLSPTLRAPRVGGRYVHTRSNIGSSSPAGVRPVRVAARRPGSRLAARSGNGSGRSPASKAFWGSNQTVCSIKRSLPRRQWTAFGWKEEEPSPADRGEGHGRGVEPGSAALKNLPAYGALNVWKVAAGTGEALPGPAMLRSESSERPVL